MWVMAHIENNELIWINLDRCQSMQRYAPTGGKAFTIVSYRDSTQEVIETPEYLLSHAKENGSLDHYDE